MPNLSLNSEPQIEVMVRIIAKGSDRPLSGSAYKVRLFDKDIFDDDYIGESRLDANGIGRIRFTHSAFGDIANIDEKPSFYFVVLKNNKQIFESKVMEVLDLATIEQYKKGEGEVINLGTFLVDA